MAMYFYASKLSAIVCATRCKQTVLQKSRGQRDRDKDKDRASNHQRPRKRHRHHGSRSRRQSRCPQSSSDSDSSIEEDDCCRHGEETTPQHQHQPQPDVGIFLLNAEASQLTSLGLGLGSETTTTTMHFRRRHSAEQLSAHDLELGFQQLKVTTASTEDANQYDVPKNPHKRHQADVNFESSVLGAGGIMYINGRIISGPLDSFPEILNPKNVIDLDKEFLFSFLLSSRLFLRPHELLGKLLDSIAERLECLESLVVLLSEWTEKFPYDYRDERMMNHVKHIVASCSDSHLEGVVSQVLSALLQRLTDLERHETDLRACQSNSTDKPVAPLNCPTATQYAQILCRLEKKLAKHIGAEEFLQCSSMILLDKQKKWDQPPSATGGPPGVQDPKKTCNLETYLDWSSRLRLFVCNEILQCSGIEERSRTVELWSGVAQYCLLVGNYNSATAILESLESPPIARLKITWSKLQVTCQQLDCMQRHAEGHGHLWQKQATVLNEQQQLSLKTDKQAKTVVSITENPSSSSASSGVEVAAAAAMTPSTSTEQVDLSAKASSSCGIGQPVGIPVASGLNAMPAASMEQLSHGMPVAGSSSSSKADIVKATTTTTTTTATICGKPNDWVVIPVFADIVKLALAERENCLQLLPNGHINIIAFDRMAAIVGAFTKHMQAMKATAVAPSSSEYEHFCSHMQQTTKLGEADLMMASFDCEEPNNAEKLMYDLN
ncbi:uncharacterized protein LOC133844153 isoform X1 [Drosophila sulfurigaster albostrigata]|uniref:uncharacterized protein LOC133844153 isoform X1 n=1 Tax=Drosophila sulfurigaster albostrigata TaxID=89887 RepID=UPI002D21A190|nr:uncharacterized protein LOC133844153 isoform X1 [Drosophila sulfurigaster albostrigata]XP_062134016.1 uncharacterized protein LOC133844153 isoform X1 [Drosophila sulfurigaster albostrigata]